jgi:gamma-glutamyltranspeptidase/glutathione hydrolase
MIATRGGHLALVIGGAGARRIISALVSVITRVADEGLGLEDALAAPRLHVDAGGVTLERPNGDGGNPDEPARFDAMTQALDGLNVAWTAQESGVFFARLNAVAIDPTTGERIGVADPRWPWSGASGPIR